MMGCTGAESDTGSTVLGSAVASNTGESGRPTPPTFAEIQDQVTLNQDQVEPLETAYSVLVAQMQARHESRQTQGGKGKHGRRSGGEPTGEVADAEKPMQTFLLAGADILTPDQFVALVDFLADYREAQREAMAEVRETRFAERGGKMQGEGRGGRGGFGGRGQQGKGFIDELNLTEDQQTTLKEAREQNREAIQALIEAAGGRGQIDEATRDQIKELREQMKETMNSILTAEQLAQLEELRETRQAERAAERETRFAEKSEARIDFLGQLLELDATQKQQILDIKTETHDQVKTLRENAREQDTPREEVREQVKQLMVGAKETIKALLDADQAAMFEALSNLKSHRGGPGGPGGPRMGRFMKR